LPVVFTDRSHGDLAVDAVAVDARRALVAPTPWSWLRQVHGARVVTVTRPGEHAGEEADAAVTATPGCTLAVQVADCAPIALVADEAVGVVHAGWRGLVAGVIPDAIAGMRALGATAIRAEVGPCIGPECYEFGVADLDRVASILGDEVRADGALDMRAGVLAALRAGGVHDVQVAPVCTACSDRHWSFRARAEAQRQAVVAWI
jgi:YfiH family protein